MSRRPFSMYRRKGNGRYYVQLWDETSKRYLPAKSAGTTNKVKARAKANAMLISFRAAQSEIPDPVFIKYLQETWDWETSSYVRARLSRRPDGLTKAYVKNNLSYIKRYASPFFARKKRSEITSRDLEAFLMHLKTTTELTPKSINSIFNAVTIPIRDAYRLGEIPYDPTRPVRKLWVPHYEKGIPSLSEVKTLIDRPWSDSRLETACLLAIVCGLRLGEIRALRLEDIENNLLQVRHSYSAVDGLKAPKNGQTRTVPLPSFLHDKLIFLAEQNPNDGSWVFWGRATERPASPSFFEDGFNSALDAIGITKAQRRERRLSFHSLRHFCNAMLRGSIPDEKLRLLIGHCTPSMTNRYDHATSVDLAMLHEAQESKILSIFGKSA